MYEQSVNNHFLPPIHYLEPSSQVVIDDDVLTNSGVRPVLNGTLELLFLGKYDKIASTDASYLQTTQQWIHELSSNPHYLYVDYLLFNTLPLFGTNLTSSQVEPLSTEAYRSWNYIHDKYVIKDPFNTLPVDVPVTNESMIVKDKPIIEPIQYEWLTNLYKWCVTSPMVILAIIGIWLCTTSIAILKPLYYTIIALIPGILGTGTFEQTLKEQPNSILGHFFTAFSTTGQRIVWRSFWMGVIGLVHYICILWSQGKVAVDFIHNHRQAIQHTKRVHEFLSNMNTKMLDFIENRVFIEVSSPAHSKFITHMIDTHHRINSLCHTFNRIVEGVQSNNTTDHLYHVGNIQATLTTIASDPTIHSDIIYAIGLCKYWTQLKTIGQHPQMNRAVFESANQTEQVEEFSKNNSPILINQMCPELLLSNSTDEINQPVTNTILLESNFVLTGPNASGKTTLLKTTMANLIYTQQYGYGFYESCTMPYLYSKFQTNLAKPHCGTHSFDSLGPDSLFQSEARQCFKIIDSASKDSSPQFCIFDELFSSTNPEESIELSVHLIEHMTNKCPHIDFIVTTHMVEICNRINQHQQDETREQPIKHIDFISMHSTTTDTSDTSDTSDLLQSVTPKPTYKVVPGICQIHGASSILRDMGFPVEIFGNSEIKNDVK